MSATASAIAQPSPSARVDVLEKGLGQRITSIDALRGFTMLVMIFVNELSGVSPNVVPAWMKHYHGKSGMTFVDVVFPAFLFVAGMSIPFALGSRVGKGEPLWKILLHILTRSASLILIGILMVNGRPDSGKMGWSGSLWLTLVFVASIFAFCSIGSRKKDAAHANAARMAQFISLALRLIGFAALAYLTFAYIGKDDTRIITLSPFSISTKYYGILGEIGWSYLIASLIFLAFQCRRTALVGCLALLYCLYPAYKQGAFDWFWLAHHLDLGGTGTHTGIMLAGTLLATTLLTKETSAHAARARFALLLVAGGVVGALLLNGLYGVSKNSATPSFCLWTTAIAAALWVGFYYLADVTPSERMRNIVRPLAIAGGNVLLAYLLSEMWHPCLEVVHLRKFYDQFAELNLACAIIRGGVFSIAVVALTALLNRLGFRLKL